MVTAALNSQEANRVRKAAKAIILVLLAIILLTATAATATAYSPPQYAPSAYGIDVSNWTSNPYELIWSAQQRGKHFIGVYITSLSHSYKPLNAARLKALQVMHMPYFLLFEEKAARPRDGYWAGVADAKKAMAACCRLGLKWSTPVYFACDVAATATPGSRVSEYYRGIRDTYGFPQGAYGGGTVLTPLFDQGLIKYGCQCWFWSEWISSTQIYWDPRAQLRQSYNVRLAGRTCGLETAWARDFGQIPRPGAVVYPPKVTTTTTLVTPETTTATAE
jgi:hypothetical protein